MNFRPLHDKVLILPAEPANTTDSGLHLVEHRKPEQTGTVVAVGPCTHPRKVEAEFIVDLIAGNNHGRRCRCEMCEAAKMLRELTQREPQVKVGDFVVFSWQAGQEIFVEDGEARYLLMREADILAVVEPEGVL